MKLTAIIHPNSKNPRIEKDLTTELHIYVREPALEGKANLAAINALANYLKVSKSQVSLISGYKSKLKTFEVK